MCRSGYIQSPPQRPYALPYASFISFVREDLTVSVEEQEKMGVGFHIVIRAKRLDVFFDAGIHILRHQLVYDQSCTMTLPADGDVGMMYIGETDVEYLRTSQTHICSENEEQPSRYIGIPAKYVEFVTGDERSVVLGAVPHETEFLHPVGACVVFDELRQCGDIHPCRGFLHSEIRLKEIYGFIGYLTDVCGESVILKCLQDLPELPLPRIDAVGFDSVRTDILDVFIHLCGIECSDYLLHFHILPFGNGKQMCGYLGFAV